MTSREINDAFMPSVPIEMASEMVMVPNSIGIPPAPSIPSTAASATSSRWTLHGVMSAAGLATPTIGEERSSSSNPIARNIARWGALSGPSVTSVLGRSGSLSLLNGSSASPAGSRGSCLLILVWWWLPH